MKIKHSGYKHLFNLMVFSVLCLLLSSTSIVMAQRKPKTLKLDVDMDDAKLCREEASLKNSQFCNLFALYETNKNDTDNDKDTVTAFNARNDMIDLVVGQVDTFYKLRKDGRKFKIRWYETILDFLGIGGNLAVTIMNGERAKTIVGAALSAVGTGRADYDKNFQVLQTQVLINKMNAKRAEILTEIIKSKDKPVRADKPSNAYSWYQAKNDLRRYLLAGTFDDALDTLVEETGEDVVKAENELRETIVGEIPTSFVATTNDANKVLIELREQLKDEDTKADAEKTLRTIFASLNEDKDLKPLFAGEEITVDSEGETIRKALISVRSKVRGQGKFELVNKINQIIVKASQ